MLKSGRKEKSKEKVVLFNEIKEPTIRKKDKKNIVKNIIKLFVNWLERNNHKSLSHCFSSLTQLKTLLKIYKFNNSLIYKMTNNGFLWKLFQYFLQTDAHLAIHKSNIMDKETHHEAVEVYLNLYPT